jgi:4-carboxymuconolactone decarboxylase
MTSVCRVWKGKSRNKVKIKTLEERIPSFELTCFFPVLSFYKMLATYLSPDTGKITGGKKDMKKTNPKPSTVKILYGDLAPKLAELTDDVLFGDVWERPQLSKRDRSLITVATLIALNRMEQLPFHLERALSNGITREEIIEVITHLAFYSGWPTSVSALARAKELFQKK